MTKKIGLFGYGVVAQGFIRTLKANDLGVEIKKICIRDPQKERDLPDSLFTTRREELLNDHEIAIVVELIDDPKAAFQIVNEALSAGKAVISANKKMIAENIETVSQWHRLHSRPFLYEAAVAGSIPIIQNIEQFFSRQKILSLRAILNGSTNYILTMMRERKLSFEDALRLAQDHGFAESDPFLDISGEDAMNKLIILAYHAFGQLVHPDQIRVESITNMEDRFFEQANAQGLKIKSVAHIYQSNGKFRYKVQPELISRADELFGVEYENNAIVLDGSLSGKQMYTGKGAGSLPTGSAVINDLALLLQGFRYRQQDLTVLRKTA